jgi:hypothetical protein
LLFGSESIPIRAEMNQKFEARCKLSQRASRFSCAVLGNRRLQPLGHPISPDLHRRTGLPVYGKLPPQTNDPSDRSLQRAAIPARRFTWLRKLLA